MANANLFAQYLQAPQSVTSKIAALDEADFRRAQMEGAQRQNRLQELAFQRDEESRANAARRGGAIQSILSQAGGDETAAVKGLRSAGFYDEAGKMESDLLGRTEKRATIAGKETENAAKTYAQRRTEIDTAIRDITMFETPEQALADLQSKVQAGKLPPEQAQGMAQLIQTNPQWQTKLLRGLMQAKDQLDLDERQATRTQQGQQSAAQLAQAAELARMQDATTRRGQNMTDTRSREASTIQREQLAQQRTLQTQKMQEEADARARGKDAAAASVVNQIANIDKALTHPGRATGTGLSSVINPANFIPGTEARDFKAVSEQIKGAAFLQAFESLKGGGAITEVEGKKAEAAIARLDTAQSDREYEAALKDLRKVMNDGYTRMTGKSLPEFDAKQTPKDNPLGAASMPGGKSNIIRFDANGNRVN